MPSRRAKNTHLDELPLRSNPRRNRQPENNPFAPHLSRVAGVLIVDNATLGADYLGFAADT